VDAARSEAAKYAEVWSHDAYRKVAPGEHHVQRFIDLAKPRADHVVCDFGCGTGRGALGLVRRNLSVCGVDFAPNCLDDGVREHLGERFRFLQHDLTTPLAEKFDYGFCTDVLEHIPPQDVGRVLYNICAASKKIYLHISTVPDVMGALIGEPLHLTVESPFWWQEKLEKIGFRTDWSHYDDQSVTFYGSVYATAQDFDDISKLNVEQDVVIANIKSNLNLGLKEIVPHEIQPDTVVYLLAGGPSLKQHEAEVIEAGKSGIPCVTVNGTYNWLLDRGIRPAAHVMVDAREFNRRFVTKHIDTCKYLVSSQVDHELVKSLPPEQTWLWHSGQSDMVKQTLQEWSEESGIKREWFPVFGASTVVSRAITLLAMLGFRKIEIFGWDSCILDDRHHAYDQPENDAGLVVPITVGNREFKCHPWMAVQANEFPKLVRHIYSQVPDLQLSVRGDGLIAAILSHSAEMNNGC
jgi:SAM-dependent methyltransferase